MRSVLILAFLVVICNGQINVINGPESLMGLTIPAPSVKLTEWQQWDPVTAEIISSPPGEPLVNISGKIVIIANPDAMFKPLRFLLELQEQGALGAIIVHLPPGVAGLSTFQKELRDHDDLIPAVGIDGDNGIMLASANMSIWITMTQDDHNDWWISMHSAGWFISSLLYGIPGFLVFGFAVYKLWRMRHYEKIILAHIVIAVDCFNCFIAFILCISHIVFQDNLFTETFFLIISTLNWPTFVGSTVLIGFYWSEILDKTQITTKSKTIFRLLMPFLVISCVLVVLEIIQIILKIGTTVDRTILLNTMFYTYIIFMFTFTIFFFVQGCRVMTFLNKGIIDTTKRRYRRATILLMISTLANVAFAIQTIIGLTDIFWDPYANAWLYATSQISIVLGASLHITSFTLRKNDHLKLSPVLM